jgi:hypothetical protein
MILNKRESLIVSLLSFPDDKLKELAARVLDLDKSGRSEVIKTIFENLRYLPDDDLADVADYVQTVRLKKRNEAIQATFGCLSEEDGQAFEDALRWSRQV